VDPQNVEIYTSGDSIRIRAELKEEDTKEERNFYRAERRYGVFEREFSLPPGVRYEDAKATFRHGVLDIVLPKSEEAKHKMKKVPVEVTEEEMAGTKGGEKSQKGKKS